MIDRQGGKMLIECDTCDSVFDFGSDDFQECWSAAKRDGWMTKKVANDWVHFCGECREARMK